MNVNILTHLEENTAYIDENIFLKPNNNSINAIFILCNNKITNSKKYCLIQFKISYKIINLIQKL